MWVNTYVIEARKANQNRNSNQFNNYRALVEKLIQLEPSDCPKFQEQLKNLHSAEIHQTEAQIKLKEYVTDKQKIQ